jgi:hypothetical protein
MIAEDVQTVDEDEVDSADEDREYHQIGDKYLCISTTFNEEKENALNMLTCYVDHLKEHFAPYCAAVAEKVEHVLSVPVLNNSEMRKTSAALIPGLVNDVQLAREKATWPGATHALIQDLFGRLIKALLKVHRSRLSVPHSHGACRRSAQHNAAPRALHAA